MSTLSQKCSAMEYALAQVEVMAAQLAERVQKWNESREAEMLGTLKIKQAEFIIGELRASLAKQAKKE
jgi:phage host-nuclease inhibitor protein Gam